MPQPQHEATLCSIRRKLAGLRTSPATLKALHPVSPRRCLCVANNIVVDDVLLDLDQLEVDIGKLQQEAK